jgi:hypothetical protein
MHQMITYRLLAAFLVFLFLNGCSVAVRKNKADGLNEAFRSGDIATAVDIVQTTNEKKNALYSLEIGQLYRLKSGRDISLSESTKNLLEADGYVERWQISFAEKLRSGAESVSSYLISENFISEYNLKNYEMGLLSQYLAINHLTEGRWNDAMVEANKMSKREKFIEAMTEEKVAIAVKASQDKAGGIDFSKANNSVDSISGYPVNLITSREVVELKNSYQNAVTYYLSAFIYESQGETSLAAPGYRLAIELKPKVKMFKDSLENLDENIRRPKLKEVADTLIIVESGFLPKMESNKYVKFFDIGSGKKILTMAYPVIPRATEAFKPNSIQIGQKTVNLDLAANIDAMSRRELKDEMPNYVIRATTRAVTALGAQVLVDAAANSRKSSGGGGSAVAGIIGIIASDAFANGMQSFNVANVSHWQTLPAYSSLARSLLQPGKSSIQLALPNGAIINEDIILNEGYNVIYVRILRNQARIFNSKPMRTLAEVRP